MIKVIAFDLIGVLLRENDYVLSDQEDKIERLFGKNSSDEEVINKAMKLTGLSEDAVVNEIKKIISSIYDVVIDLREIKNKYKDVKLFVASNHVSYVKDFIREKYGNLFDKIIISASLGSYKPKKAFFEALINQAKVKPEEILFLDDRQENVDAALAVGIKAVLIEGYNVLEVIDKNLKKDVNF